jgi:hypothetical protein
MREVSRNNSLWRLLLLNNIHLNEKEWRKSEGEVARKRHLA